MFKIGWGYIKGYKKNTMFSILGIGFSVMLMFSLLDMSGKIMEQYYSMLLKGLNYDEFYYNFNLDQIDQIYEYLEEEDVHITKEIDLGQAQAQARGEKTNVLAVEGQWLSLYRKSLLKGSMPEESYQICIEDRYSREKKVTIGDELELSLMDSEGKSDQVKFTVSGIVSNSNTRANEYFIYTSFNTGKLITNQNGYVADNSKNKAYILVDQYKSDEETFEKAFQMAMEVQGKLFPDIDPNGIDRAKIFGHIIFNNEKVEIFQEEGAYKGVSQFLYFIIIFTFISMTLFIYNTISIQTKAKLQQYGTLRCLGMDGKSFIKLLLYELLFYTGAGLLIGLLFGKGLNYLIANKLINTFIVGSYNSPTKIEFYLLTGVLAFASVFLAVGRIFIKTIKENPIQMLSYNEKTKNIKVKKPAKNYLYDLAKRNISRNRANTLSLTITIVLVSILLILIINLIASIDFGQKFPSSFSDMEIWTSLDGLTNEDLDRCRNH